MKPDINGGKYALRYAEFVVPLVEAVQQQQKMMDERDERINKLEAEVAELKMLVKGLLGQKE